MIHPDPQQRRCILCPKCGREIYMRFSGFFGECDCEEEDDERMDT